MVFYDHWFWWVGMIEVQIRSHGLIAVANSWAFVNSRSRNVIRISVRCQCHCPKIWGPIMGRVKYCLAVFILKFAKQIWIWPPPPLICSDFLTKSGSKIGGLRLCPVPCTLCLVSCVLCPVSSVLCLVFASSFLCPVSGKRVLIVISHVCVLVWWLRGERGVAAIKCKCLWSRSASNCQRRTVLQQ